MGFNSGFKGLKEFLINLHNMKRGVSLEPWSVFHKKKEILPHLSALNSSVPPVNQARTCFAAVTAVCFQNMTYKSISVFANLSLEDFPG